MCVCVLYCLRLFVHCLCVNHRGVIFFLCELVSVCVIYCLCLFVHRLCVCQCVCLLFVCLSVCVCVFMCLWVLSVCLVSVCMCVSLGIWYVYVSVSVCACVMPDFVVYWCRYVCLYVCVCVCVCFQMSLCVFIYLCPSLPFYVSFLSVSCTFILSSVCFESTISSHFCFHNAYCLCTTSNHARVTCSSALSGQPSSSFVSKRVQ